MKNLISLLIIGASVWVSLDVACAIGRWEGRQEVTRSCVAILRGLAKGSPA